MKHAVRLITVLCLCVLGSRQLNAQEQAAKDSVVFHLSDTLLLDEVTVTAPIPPMEQKGDTVVFNPNAFKVPEGAYLEALVRRIPGLSYDPKNHSLSFNGYPIREITVNGKEFFKGNNKIALENIPASFVSKLKVYDKETDKEKDTGIKDTEKNYVLDLQTKKKLNGTLTASAEAGYGNHKKKNASAQLFRFEEGGDNFSVIGRSGNQDFTTPDERNISHSIGASASRHLTKNVELWGGIGYNYNRNGATGSGYNENYLTGTTQYGINTNNSLSKDRNASGNLGLRWNIDEKTSVNIGGNARFLPSTSRNDTHSSIFSVNPQVDVRNPFAQIEETDQRNRINDHLSQTEHKRNSWGYDINASFTRKLTPKGNNLSISYLANRNRMTDESFTLAEATYFRLKDIWGNDSVSRQHQFRKSPYDTRSHETELAYTQVFGENARLQFAYAFKYEQETSNQDTYDLSFLPETGQPAIGNLPQGYESGHIDSLSNRSESNTASHRFTLTYNYQGKVWSIQTRLSVIPQRRSLKQTDANTRIDTASTSIEWHPSLALTRQKDNWYAMLSYSGYTRQPSLASLLAPTQYVSPLLVTRSNPDLKPSYSHAVYFMINNFTKGINTSMAFNQEFNSVSQATSYDPQTGKRETFPVNINGNWSLMGNAGYNRSMGLFRLFANASSNFAHRISLIDDTGSSQMAQSATRALGLSSDIRLSYVPEWGNIDLNGRWDYQQSKNSLQGNNTYTRYYTMGITTNIRLPWNRTFDTDAAYNIRNGTGMGNDDNNEILWNIRLGWKFLKEKQGEISFYWADILSQKKSYYRYASATRFSETYSEQLRGYFMISFKYQFNKMN